MAAVKMSNFMRGRRGWTRAHTQRANVMDAIVSGDLILRIAQAGVESGPSRQDPDGGAYHGPLAGQGDGLPVTMAAALPSGPKQKARPISEAG